MEGANPGPRPSPGPKPSPGPSPSSQRAFEFFHQKVQFHPQEGQEVKPTSGPQRKDLRLFQKRSQKAFGCQGQQTSEDPKRSQVPHQVEGGVPLKPLRADHREAQNAFVREAGCCAGLPMQAPMCLVENSSNHQLDVNPEALAILSRITQPVVVVAIVGMYRTGKSYLMNKLARQRKGFTLGSTIQSQTKGIWMWCIPHPSQPRYTLVLLDTEGLGDTEKGDARHDSWIFSLAILLSSIFVYNSKGVIDQYALEKLQYVTELTERIRVSSQPCTNGVEDSNKFVSFFPDFLWVVRDFILDLELDGRCISEDEYLERALKLQKGDHPNTQMLNLPRKCIRQFFPSRKCFTFSFPAPPKLVGHLDELGEDHLYSDFVQQANNFCTYIFQNTKIKTLQGGIVVNGPRLAMLVKTYVETIRSGNVPCLENAVLALAQIENAEAVKVACSHYTTLMAQQVQLPTGTLLELLEAHRVCEREALRLFMQRSFKDKKQKFQRELAEILQLKLEELCQKNEEESTKLCTNLIQKIFRPQEMEVKQGLYSKPGGYQLFIQKRKELEQEYTQIPRKGPQAEVCLQNYWKSQEEVADSILQLDQSLSQKDKEIEVERAKSQATMRELKKMQQVQEKMQELLEQQEKSYKENWNQLMEKMKQDNKKLMEDQQKTLHFRLAEQARLLQEGFSKEVNLQKNQYKALQELYKQDTASRDQQIQDLREARLKAETKAANYKRQHQEKKESFQECIDELKQKGAKATNVQQKVQHLKNDLSQKEKKSICPIQ
ncbi:guanylate-binding protein 1-like [Tachyglossus aculeatus]|uniref:guanylate-binding protein 1-like n=1 Tax=Tachyglossus aculeatus TaxID=9261 RepID=UPI0018F39746|nr:guanylate-binding protein 1-like [Tachyglossus aculeatus]